MLVIQNFIAELSMISVFLSLHAVLREGVFLGVNQFLLEQFFDACGPRKVTVTFEYVVVALFFFEEVKAGG